MQLKTQTLSTLGMASLGMAASVPRGENIVGGNNVWASDYYWQVSLANNGTFWCGGAIISDTWILTAAHCVDAQPPVDVLTIRSGSEYTDHGGDAHAVQSYILHPDYNKATLLNDVAVIQIAGKFGWDPQTWPVKMVDEQDGYPAADTPATVAGWGLTEYRGTAPKRLQAVDAPPIDMDTCIVDYVDSNLHIQPGMFCAGVQWGRKGSCNGDSGGALVDKKTKKMIGIVSWGFGCAWAGKPGVYSSVAFFREWIKEVTGV